MLNRSKKIWSTEVPHLNVPTKVCSSNCFFREEGTPRGEVLGPLPETNQMESIGESY